MPADALTMTKLLSYGLSTNWERELLRAEMTRELGPELAARLDPGYPEGNPVVLTPGAGWSGDGLALAEQIAKVRDTIGLAVEATGSNNWAVSGERSATGGPLMAGDPHLPPSMPGITYQVGLYLGDRFCRGASLPGLPGVTMGQNNDVAWSFTNVMADVMDLFIERIDGDEYEFDGERRPLEVIDEEIAVKGQAWPDRLAVRVTEHGPIVNEALRADDAEPLALRFSALDYPGITEANFEVLDFDGGPGLVEGLAAHAHPVSNLVWADRHGSIGYKTVGRHPAAKGRLPRSAEARLVGRVRVGGLGSRTRSCPRSTTPRRDSSSRPTTGSLRRTTRTTSRATTWTATGRNGSRSCFEARPEHDLESFESIQTDMQSIPGLETVHRLVRLRPRDQRELSAIERLRSWDGDMGPDSIAATIYQAFTLRLGQEVARAAIADRDLIERWLDRADNGFVAHVTSPWRWQAHLLALWDEGDDELVGRAMGRPGPRCASRRDGRPGVRVRAGSGRMALGPRASAGLPARARRRQPLLRPDLQPPAGGGRRPGDRRAGGLGPQSTPSPRSGHRVGGWSPTRPPPRSRAGRRSPASPGHPASPHYDDLQPDWKEGRTQPMAGEGPWEKLDADARRLLRFASGGGGVGLRMMSRRSEIQLSPEEQRELIDSERVVVVSSLGQRGWPHSMPLWYVPRDGEIWIYTYAKSQKVKNLERDARATLLIETGHEYAELRGVEIEAEAEIHRDLDTVFEMAKALTSRYAGGAQVDEAAAEALRAQARKRVAIRFAPVRVATWDHRKLGGVY